MFVSLLLTGQQNLIELLIILLAILRLFVIVPVWTLNIKGIQSYFELVNNSGMALPEECRS